jgi:hypothetical protein
MLFMRKPVVFINPLMCIFFVAVFATASFAQNTAPKWTPDELKELFNYCDKPALIQQLKISSETADRIGEIDNWALLQIKSVEANTNEAYATPNEVEADVIKKYKALKLSADQLKSLSDRRQQGPMSGCAVTTLVSDARFDTVVAAKAVQQYKTLYRKQLIDKAGIVGRMADQVIETEVWKQKEAASIAKIPETDFSRVRKTVDLYQQRDHRYRAIGLNDQQIATTVEFFDKNQLWTKN